MRTKLWLVQGSMNEDYGNVNRSQSLFLNLYCKYFNSAVKLFMPEKRPDKIHAQNANPGTADEKLKTNKNYSGYQKRYKKHKAPMRDRLCRIIMETESGTIDTAELVKTYLVKFSHTFGSRTNSSTKKWHIISCLERFEGRNFRK